MTLESPRLSRKRNIERIHTATKRLQWIKKSLLSRILAIAAKLKLLRTSTVPMYGYGLHLVNLDNGILTEVNNLLDNDIRWVIGAQTPKLVTRTRADLQVCRGISKRSENPRRLL